MGFCKPLKEVVPRIELLGFTLGQVKKEYLDLAEKWCEEYQSLENEEKKSRVGRVLFTATL